MQVLNIVTFNNDYCKGGRFMLVLKEIFILFLVLSMVVSFCFYALSHAPSKMNKTIKRAKMRRWSTIFIIVTIMIAVLSVSQPILGCSIVISFVLLDMAFSKIIETL